MLGLCGERRVRAGGESNKSRRGKRRKKAGEKTGEKEERMRRGRCQRCSGIKALYVQQRQQQRRAGFRYKARYGTFFVQQGGAKENEARAGKKCVRKQREFPFCKNKGEWGWGRETALALWSAGTSASGQATPQ